MKDSDESDLNAMDIAYTYYEKILSKAIKEGVFKSGIHMAGFFLGISMVQALTEYKLLDSDVDLETIEKSREKAQEEINQVVSVVRGKGYLKKGDA